jgi:hypothetical protein
MIRAIVSLAILLSSAAFLPAQTECTRSMLKTAVDSYIAAQKAGDLSKMTFAPKMKFKENMSEVAKGKGDAAQPHPLWGPAHAEFEFPHQKIKARNRIQQRALMRAFAFSTSGALGASWRNSLSTSTAFAGLPRRMYACPAK